MTPRTPAHPSSVPRRQNRPLACLIGDLSMLRALGRSGIPVALATADPGSAMTRSRYCDVVVKTASWVDEPKQAIADVVAWARTQPVPPVVFYQGDHDLLAVSRYREQLAPHLRCLLPPAGLVEDLVDKLQFAELAQRLSLPVPATRALHRGAGLVSELRGWDRFPCVLKPAMRTRWFGSELQQRAVGTTQKALRIEDRTELERLLPLLEGHETDFIVQAAVEGGEERILSYHAYVRPGGERVAEFTGKKVRTAPRRYGMSSYVEITDDPAVKRLGHSVLEQLRFSGVLKMDFKQDERDGRLYLLEINPRFNLWHHPAALAGVSLPELVYRDCVEPGSARPAASAARTGVRWLSVKEDRRSLREYRAAGELSLIRWLWQVVTADVNEDLCLSDPAPWLADFFGKVKRKLGRAFKAAQLHRAPAKGH
jgi:D-aspartate ligase